MVRELDLSKRGVKGIRTSSFHNWEESV